MKKGTVLGLMGLATLVGIGVYYVLNKEDEKVDIPDLDMDIEEDFFDKEIANEFDKEPMPFEKDMSKIFDNNTETTNNASVKVNTIGDDIIIAEPSDYENETFEDCCGISRAMAISTILANSSDYTEEQLNNMIGSDLAIIYTDLESLAE